MSPATATAAIVAIFALFMIPMAVALWRLTGASADRDTWEAIYRAGLEHRKAEDARHLDELKRVADAAARQAWDAAKEGRHATFEEWQAEQRERTGQHARE
jgi:hypothetical protein